MRNVGTGQYHPQIEYAEYFGYEVRQFHEDRLAKNLAFLAQSTAQVRGPFIGLMTLGQYNLPSLTTLKSLIVYSIRICKFWA
jgi:hypothetical protein